MKPPQSPHIEVVLPVYNEVRNILPLLKELDKVAAALKGEARLSYLFVNDGSRDGTWELLYRLNRERGDVRVVDLIHNFGHNSALAAGVDHVDADIAVFMDADLQDPPDAIIEMLARWKKGARTVVAERGERQEKNKWAFKAFYFVFHRLAKRMPPIDFGTHSMLDRSVVERMRLLKEKNRYFPGLVSYASGEIVAIPVDRMARAHGKSRVGPWGLINLAVTACLSFSNTPVDEVKERPLYIVHRVLGRKTAVKDAA
jgi:dolichol-phosphate mannosyltransferase